MKDKHKCFAEAIMTFDEVEIKEYKRADGTKVEAHKRNIDKVKDETKVDKIKPKRKPVLAEKGKTTIGRKLTELVSPINKNNLSLKEIMREGGIEEEDFANVYEPDLHCQLSVELTSKDIVEIDDLNVEEEFKGQGNFGKMMKRVQEYFPDRKIQIHWIVNRNLAEKFIALGWDIVKEEKLFNLGYASTLRESDEIFKARQKESVKMKEDKQPIQEKTYEEKLNQLLHELEYIWKVPSKKKSNNKNKHFAEALMFTGISVESGGEQTTTIPPGMIDKKKNVMSFANALTQFDELEKGIEEEKEHSDLYEMIKKEFEKTDKKIPWTLEEFTKIIAESHIEKVKNYYSLLKNVEDFKDVTDTEKKIIEYFKDNPEPEDEDIHELAEKLGYDDASEFEDDIYKLLGKFIGTANFSFDEEFESKHPRDKGKFATKAGAGAIVESKVELANKMKAQLEKVEALEKKKKTDTPEFKKELEKMRELRSEYKEKTEPEKESKPTEKETVFTKDTPAGKLTIEFDKGNITKVKLGDKESKNNMFDPRPGKSNIIQTQIGNITISDKSELEKINNMITESKGKSEKGLEKIIPGINELKKSKEEHESYSTKSRAETDKSIEDVFYKPKHIEKPKTNIDELIKKYPKANFYLKAQKILNTTHNAERMSAAEKAIDILKTGGGIKKAEEALSDWGKNSD